MFLRSQKAAVDSTTSTRWLMIASVGEKDVWSAFNEKVLISAEDPKQVSVTWPCS